MTTKFIIIIFSLLSICLKSQNFNCEDFSQNIVGNLGAKVDFVTEEYFNSLVKDSIKNYQKVDKDISSIQKEFNKKFNRRITEHCINSKVYFESKVQNYSNCNEKNTIKLVDKIENYYIFNLRAFEIDDYLLFNSKDETIYFFNSIPTILDNGDTLITLKFNSVYFHGINYHKFDNGDFKNFDFEFSRQYRPEKTYIIRDWANKTKILLKLIRYDLKEVSNTFKDGVKYDYDKERYCRKFVVISQ